MTIRPRTLVFGGRMMVDALWFSDRIVGREPARLRVLACCTAMAAEGEGSSPEVLTAPDGYLVVLRPARSFRVRDLEAAPVVQHDGVWLAVPLEDDERAQLSAAPGSFVQAIAGRAVVVPAASLVPIDLGQWLDVSALETIEAGPCAPPPVVAAAPRMVAEDPPSSARALLGGAVPPEDPNRAALLAALATASKQTDGPRGAPRAGTIDGGSVPSLFDSVMQWFGGWFNMPAHAELGGGGGGGGSGGGPPMPRSAPKPGLLQRLYRRMVVRSPLSVLIGRRQAQYIERTLRMFENGNVDDALRHAIPFSSLPGAPTPASISVPSPRSELRLTMKPSAAASSSFNLGGALYDRFRALYREAAKKLEEDDRIEEAAYVLADLLSEPQEAVALLERHKRYALAAQLAQSRDLAAGLVIRLWFLAGDAARAVIVARRTGAFADAVERLAAKHPDLSERLRVMWADRLATAGDFAAAVRAIWPVERARPLARRWIDLAIEFGGRSGIELIPKKLEHFGHDPEALEQVGTHVLALLEQTSDAALELRGQLGHAWSKAPVTAVASAVPIGRALARQLMLDAASEGGAPGPARALIAALDDPILRHDAQNLAVPKNSTPVARSRVLSRQQRGLMAVTDAIALANGRLLVALGEAGMRVLDTDGRTLRRYEHPAEHLVRADSGNRAIGLIRRGATTTLTRIDLVTGRADKWCDARFDLHVDSFDGASWFVSTDDAIVSLDAQSPGFDALWRVGRIEHPIIALARDSTKLSLCLNARDHVQIWCYELTAGGPVLRRRNMLDIPAGQELSPGQTRLCPDGRVMIRVYDPTRVGVQSAFTQSPLGSVVQARVMDTEPIVPRGDHALVLRLLKGQVELHRRDLSTLSQSEDSPCLVLQGCEKARLRTTADTVLVYDDLGRIVELDKDLGITRTWKT